MCWWSVPASQVCRLRWRHANARFPAERLVDPSYAEYAAQKLGPFVPENQDSKFAGCR